MTRHRYARVFALLALSALALCLTACTLPFLGKRPPSTPATGSQGPCVVLALPASGSYAAIAAKIRNGADLAQKELASAGLALRLEVVNTEAPDWLQRLDALPAACTLVGGPLQTRNYAQAHKAGALEKRVFFSFTPSLEPGDEGVRAWRFFPSPQDQIDALVAFVTDSLNIRSFGAFSPNDAYAARMTGRLEQSLAARNLLLQKATYNKADPTSWSDAVAPLIDAQTPAGAISPIPQTRFEALFLPDSWKNMDMLTTSLLYHGEDRLVLMGTTLWEQGLAGKQIPNAQKYALTIFPGAWKQAQAPRALQTPGADFWTALGFDFARFGAVMGLTFRPDPHQVTAAARRAANQAWAMAPITWDTAGVAHQKLFVFGVSPQGMTPVDAATLRQVRAQILQQAALRMQGQPPVDAEGNPLVVPEGGAEAPAVGQMPLNQSAGAPIMGNRPRPSYKLSLPPAR